MIRMQLIGAKEIDAALAELPKVTSKAVLRRALMNAAKPTLEAAIALEGGSRRKTRTPKLGSTLEITSSLKRTQERGTASSKGVEVYVGSSAPDAHWKEFGTAKVPASPFLRPAWESTKDKVLAAVVGEIWTALAKAARTLARKAQSGTLGKSARDYLSQ